VEVHCDEEMRTTSAPSRACMSARPWAKRRQGITVTSSPQFPTRKSWIASAFALRASADAVVARAPRNDGPERFHQPLNVIASEAKQSRGRSKEPAVTAGCYGNSALN
jgi:hypothetical protein